MSRSLPPRPNLDHLRNEAKALLRSVRAGDATAIQRIQDVIGERPRPKLTDVQHVIAREYGFASWTQLRMHVRSLPDIEHTVADAADLAFAIVRFAQQASHPARPGHLEKARLGEDVYSFMPSTRRIPREQVPAFLAGLPSPAMLSPTTTRGIVALYLLDELAGDRAAGFRHGLENQCGNLDDMIRPLALTDEAPVILEFADEVHIVPLAAVRTWAERFIILVGWNVSETKDPRAAARLNLFGSGGVLSVPEPR